MRQRDKAQPPRKAAVRPWKAQGILAICLLLAFAGPYMAVHLFGLAKNRQWQRSGLSPYEIDRWRESGFRSVDEAIRWRNGRFQPPGAKLWKEAGHEPELASRWHDLGFAPREARRWREHGFLPEDAAPWRDGGFLYRDARKWRDAGVGAAEAREKWKRGIYSP